MFSNLIQRFILYVNVLTSTTVLDLDNNTLIKYQQEYEDNVEYSPHTHCSNLQAKHDEKKFEELIETRTSEIFTVIPIQKDQKFAIENSYDSNQVVYIYTNPDDSAYNLHPDSNNTEIYIPISNDHSNYNFCQPDRNGFEIVTENNYSSNNCSSNIHQQNNETRVQIGTESVSLNEDFTFETLKTIDISTYPVSNEFPHAYSNQQSFENQITSEFGNTFTSDKTFDSSLQVLDALENIDEPMEPIYYYVDPIQNDSILTDNQNFLAQSSIEQSFDCNQKEHKKTCSISNCYLCLQTNKNLLNIPNQTYDTSITQLNYTPSTYTSDQQMTNLENPITHDSREIRNSDVNIEVSNNCNVVNYNFSEIKELIISGKKKHKIKDTVKYANKTKKKKFLDNILQNTDQKSDLNVENLDKKRQLIINLRKEKSQNKLKIFNLLTVEQISKKKELISIIYYLIESELKNILSIIENDQNNFEFINYEEFHEILEKIRFDLLEVNPLLYLFENANKEKLDAFFIQNRNLINVLKQKIEIYRNEKVALNDFIYLFMLDYPEFADIPIFSTMNFHEELKIRINSIGGKEITRRKFLHVQTYRESLFNLHVYFYIFFQKFIDELLCQQKKHYFYKLYFYETIICIFDLVHIQNNNPMSYYTLTKHSVLLFKVGIFIYSFQNTLLQVVVNTQGKRTLTNWFLLFVHTKIETYLLKRELIFPLDFGIGNSYKDFQTNHFLNTSHFLGIIWKNIFTLNEVKNIFPWMYYYKQLMQAINNDKIPFSLVELEIFKKKYEEYLKF